MFSVGDKFKVKSNGLTGNILGVTNHLDPDKKWRIEYRVAWDHHPYGSYTYDDANLISEWELLVIEKEAEQMSKDFKSAGIVPLTTECAHEWAKYQGFNDSFEYCKKCDQKRNP